VYNVLGQEVAALLNNKQIEAGKYQINFDAVHLASGVYYYRIDATSTENQHKATFVQVKKMMVLK